MTDPHQLRPDHAPTPFTAAEIRAGCPAGRTVLLRMDETGTDNPAPSYRSTRFLTCDDDGAEQDRGSTDADGTAIEPRISHRSSWLDLQAHASFPSAATTVEPDRIELPIGTLDCLRYRITDRTDGTTTTFWFATELPGMPVLIVSEHDSGKVSTMTMVGNEITR